MIERACVDIQFQVGRAVTGLHDGQADARSSMFQQGPRCVGLQATTNRKAGNDVTLRYDTTIRCDTVCLTCSKKLTDSQFSLPYGTNKKCKKKD